MIRSPRRLTFAPILGAWLLVTTGSATVLAHDIPNERVDRSTQVTLLPDRLLIDFEVSLSELTLIRDLRNLVGAIPDADRRALFHRYGQETAVLNARGFLIEVDGQTLVVKGSAFDLMVEEHPRFLFHFEAQLPRSTGRLTVHDTNYLTSEGTSRLAIRGRDGMVVEGDALPEDVGSIPLRPVWQLSDSEELRTRRVDVGFRMTGSTSVSTSTSSPPPARTRRSEAVVLDSTRPTNRLTAWFDDAGSWPWLVLCLVAFGLGALHSLQPGHGKAIVALSGLDRPARSRHGVVVGLAAALTHFAIVLVIALGLWLSHWTRHAAIDRALSFASGFVIAAIGAWRLGRCFRGATDANAELVGREDSPYPSDSTQSAWAIGISAGMVPCWEAILLLLLAEAVGRLPLGVVMVAAFSAGMATILVAIGFLATWLSRWSSRFDPPRPWRRWLNASAAFGLVLLGWLILSGAAGIASSSATHRLAADFPPGVGNPLSRGR